MNLLSGYLCLPDSIRITALGNKSLSKALLVDWKGFWLFDESSVKNVANSIQLLDHVPHCSGGMSIAD